MRKALFLVAAASSVLLSGWGPPKAVASDSLQETTIDGALRARFEGASPIPVAILLQTQLLLGPRALDDFASRNSGRARSELRSEVVGALKSAARSEQQLLLGALDDPAGARSLWIANAVFVSLTPEEIRSAAALDVVRYIYGMPAAPVSYLRPGAVGSVVSPRPSSPFTPSGKRVPWNLEEIGAPAAWAEGATGEGVVVAMIDNGTNYEHPDLAQRVWTNPHEVPNNGQDDDDNGLVDDYHGFDFARGRAEVTWDPSLGRGAGHGTWTSGIVLGDGTGGTVTGVAPRARLMVSIVGGRTYAMGRALEYALEEGADVATMSFSLPGLGNVRGLWRLMADHAVAGGLVLVSGAGNFQQSAPEGIQQRIPEGIPSVISVGGVARSLELMPYSSLGPVSWSSVALYEDHPALIKPDVAAFPGPDYPLLRPEGPGYLDPGGPQGNSFSGPHAAGVAALVLSVAPETPAWRVKAILEETARDLPPEARDLRTGSGLLDAAAAVRAARGG
ncbi:MAG: S8 family serine peptidase [Gemmatimonadetes bacterium]|nr:S8 family serine peptidase [Gemmatimonadota bacterium]